jgi:hypothetical protein
MGAIDEIARIKLGRIAHFLCARRGKPISLKVLVMGRINNIYE